MRVLLTQPAPRVHVLAARLRARGHEPLVFSGTRIESLLAGSIGPLPQRLSAARCVVFVSPGAIDVVHRALQAAPAAGWPAGSEIAIVGPGSLEALTTTGWLPAVAAVHLPPQPPYDADALLALPRFSGPVTPGERLLVVTGQGGRSGWLETLRRRGFEVDALLAYRRQAVEPDADSIARLQRWLDERQPVISVFTSSGAVAEAARRLQALVAGGWLLSQPALAIHPHIAQALTDRQWMDVRLIAPGETGLVGAIESRE